MTDVLTPHELAPEASEAPPQKYLVAVLYYGAVDREHDKCVKALHGHPRVFDVLEMTGCPYIDIGRSICATAVLDNPAVSGILFIDHDMVFDPAEAIRCIESAIESQGTVGAAYSMRKPGHIIGAVEGKSLEPGQKVVFFEGGQRWPANYLGMGMTAIPKSVLEKLVAAATARHDAQKALVAELRGLLSESPYFPHALDLLDQLVPQLQGNDLERLTSGISTAPVVPFFSLIRKGGYYYGEDVSFCLRSHEANAPVFLDTRLRVYHKGSYCYGLEDVGMEVPYCERLEALDVVDPKASPALFSRNGELAAANASLLEGAAE